MAYYMSSSVVEDLSTSRHCLTGEASHSMDLREENATSANDISVKSTESSANISIGRARRGGSYVSYRELLTSRKFRFALKAAFVGSIGGLLFGYDLGVISGALPFIKDTFNLTVYEEELVTSLMYAGCVIGAAFGGSVCDYLGRRKTVFVVSAMFILGAIVTAAAPTLAVLLIGRFIIGIGIAVSAIVDVTYLTEISPIEYRGSVVSTNEFMITLGFLFSFVIDYTFSFVNHGWRYMIAFPSILAVVWSTLMIYMPESPRWYIVNGKREEAFQVFSLIYDTVDEARRETQKAMKSVEALRLSQSRSRLSNHTSSESQLPIFFNNSYTIDNNTSINQVNASNNQQTGTLPSRDGKDNGAKAYLLHTASVWEVISVWKLSIFVSVSLMIFQNFSGNAGILVYAPEFFKIAGYGSSASSIATITLGIIKVVSTFLTLSVVDKFGRRLLLLSGISGMAISLIFMSIIFAYSDISNNINDDHSQSHLSPAMSGLILFLVCTYIASYGIGYGPVTWLVASEIFSDEIRGRTLGFATIANWLSTLIVVATFLSSVQAIGLSFTLVIYACLCGIAFVFVSILVPETAMREPSANVMALHLRFNAFVNCLHSLSRGRWTQLCTCFRQRDSPIETSQLLTAQTYPPNMITTTNIIHSNMLTQHPKTMSMKQNYPALVESHSSGDDSPEDMQS